MQRAAGEKRRPEFRKPESFLVESKQACPLVLLRAEMPSLSYKAICNRHILWKILKQEMVNVTSWSTKVTWQFSLNEMWFFCSVKSLNLETADLNIIPENKEKGEKKWKKKGQLLCAVCGSEKSSSWDSILNWCLILIQLLNLALYSLCY